MPATTVTETSYTTDHGDEVTQYRTTVPKGLAEAFDLGGKKIEWAAESQNTLSVSVVEDE